MKQFEGKMAKLCAHLSKAAYERFESDPGPLLSELRKHSLELVALLCHKETGTQGFVARSQDFAVVCFRGTEEDGLDILTDIRCRLTSSASGGRHTGFFASFGAIREQLESALQRIDALPIYACGHSLGGALAKVAMIELSSNWRACYTFGSPPVCDVELGKTVKVPIFRFIAGADIVPRVMSLGGIFYWLGKNIIKLLRSASKRLHKSLAPFDKLLRDLEEISKDTSRYCHFGEELLFQDSGPTLKKLTNSELFFAAFGKRWQRFFEDHKMDNYLNLVNSRDLEFNS